MAIACEVKKGKPCVIDLFESWVILNQKNAILITCLFYASAHLWLTSYSYFQSRCPRLILNVLNGYPKSIVL